MAEPKDKLSILMLGEALDRPGGVVTVEKATLAIASNQLTFRHVPTLPRDRAWLQLGKLVTVSRAVIQMLWCLVTKSVDIVHIHVSMGPSVYRKSMLAGIAMLFGKPVIMHTHGGEFSKQFPTMLRPLRRLVASLLRRSDAVIVLAETWRRFYINVVGVDPKRVVILRNPVTLPSSLPARSTGPPIRFLYLGMLSEPKGAFDLIQAMAALPYEDRQNVHLTMAGHGQIVEAGKLVADLGLQETVTILGWLDHEARDTLLAEVHGFILPSHFEGLPMALLEAMSWGLAIVATPVGGIPDVVVDGKNGLLVQPGDTAALAAAVKRLTADPVLRQRLGNEARTSVEPYSAAGYADCLIAIYRDVLPGGVLAGAST